MRLLPIEPTRQTVYERHANHRCVERYRRGVGFGDGDARKRFVEDADDASLIIDSSQSNRKLFKVPQTQRFNCCSNSYSRKIVSDVMQIVEKKPDVQVWGEVKQRISALVQIEFADKVTWEKFRPLAGNDQCFAIAEISTTALD